MCCDSDIQPGAAVAKLPRSTVEQWGVLRAVVEEGGFALAAEALNRSQSSISYAVARLQEAVGVDLLEHRGRRAVLTEAGAALLAEVTPLIEEMNRIERRGRGIARGEAVRIRLIVDALFPKERLFAALQQIASAYPDTEVHLIETVRQTVHDLPADSYDLAILVIEPEATDTDRIADLSLIAVASPGHPLLDTNQPVTRAALTRYPSVEIRGYDADDNETRQGRRWRMSTVDSAIDAVRHGLCYGWLPTHLIRTELERHELRPLRLSKGGVRHVPLGLYRNEATSDNDAATAELARLLGVRTDGD